MDPRCLSESDFTKSLSFTLPTQQFRATNIKNHEYEALTQSNSVYNFDGIRGYLSSAGAER